MADGESGIKGIGVAVTADASQIKRVWNEAIQGFSNQKINVTIEAVEGKSFERIFSALRNQHVEIGVTLKPTRQTIRDFRKDFNERLANEGGARVPIKAKALTQREGKLVRDAISTAIGSPIVEVILNWKWGPGGPPPTSFQGSVQPGPGGGGGGPEPTAWGPFHPPPTAPTSTQDVNTFIRQEVARRMAAQGQQPQQTAAAPPRPVQQKPEAEPETIVAATAKVAKKERKPHRYAQRPGESTEEWTARLLEEHASRTQKLTSTSADVRRRANNALVQIEKRLGIESDREAEAVPGRTVTKLGPKESRIAEVPIERPQRTAEGKLLADAISEAVDAARRSGDLTGPTPGTLGARRLAAQEAYGVKVGPMGIEDLGQLASLAPGARAQNALMERINDRIFGIDEPERTTGFRGGGRATRSAFSDAGEGSPLEIVGPAGPSERINARKSRQLVETGAAITAFLDEIEAGSRTDFRRDAEEFAAFRKRWSSGETGWGEGFKRAQDFLAKGEEVKAIFGERAFDPDTGTFQLTHEGAFEGALPARAQLDAMARARKLPGVGPGAVRYAQAQTRDDIPAGKMTQQGLDYIAQRDALSSLIDTFFEGRRVEAENASTKAAGEQAAATTAEALTPPKRPIVPRRRPDEDIPAYRARKAEALEPYFASVEKFRARQAKLMPGLNDPSLMTYPSMDLPPRQGLTPEAIEGVRRPTEPEGTARTLHFGVGAFSPFRPKGVPQPAAEPDIPDLSDLGFSRDDVMRAFSEPAMAAGGVAGPPVPPGTVSGGGGLGGAGGVVPVRVTNWPSALEGEAAAFGPAASIPPSDEMLKMFQQATSQGFQSAMDQLGWKPRQEAEAEPTEKEPKNPDDIFERGGSARSLRSTLNLAGRLGLPAVDPSELAAIQRNADLEIRGGESFKQLDRAEDFARTAVEASPARAVATATGQIFSNLPFIGGRSKILERQREALRATGEARAIQGRLVDERASLAVMEKYVALLPEGSKRHQQMAKDVEVQRKRVEATGIAYDEAAKKATTLNREVARVGDVARSFAAGVVGTITGQILFQSVFGAAQAAVGAATQALGPVIERQMGYKNAAAATTNELASQTAQTGQLTEALVEQRIAAANLNKVSGDRIDKIITERTELMAGNKQIEEQTKLYATASDIQQGNMNLGGRGNGRTRRGSDLNLYESTGGLFNTSFFAPQQSTQEAIGNLFREAGRTVGRQEADAGFGLFSNRPTATNIGRTPLAAADVLPASVRDFEASLQAANKSLELHAATTESDRQKVSTFADALDRADMQDFANAVRQSGFYVAGLDQMSPEEQEQVLTDAAENFARGVARRDPAQLIDAMGDQIRAAVEGSFETARIERKLTIPAQRGLANLANPVIPLSSQDIIGAPATGGGLSELAFGRQGIAPGARPQFQRAAATSLFAQQRQGVAEQRELGAIDELFAPLGEGVKREYLEIRGNIKSIGSELAALQNEQVNIQINLSTQQFNEQLRQVRRGLADARERATGVDAPGNRDNLGLLERRGIMLSRQSATVGFQQQQLGLQSQALQLQNQLLGRRSQLLSFQSTELGFQSKQLGFQSTALQLAQNQRQINFQVAAAGFTAPGTTPEERAARISEAKAEAAVAQAQQDIAVKQFGIEQQQFGLEQAQYGIAQQQYQLDAAQIAIQQQAYVLAQQQYGLSVAQFQNQQAIIDAQNARAVEDLTIQERLINAAMVAQQQLAANEKTIDNLRRALEAEMQMAGSYLSQASGVATQIAQTSTALLGQFGGDLGKIVTAYANAWISFRNRATMSSSEWLSQNPETRYAGGLTGAERYNAPGDLGMVTMPTKMVVGDAGGEMVAILRNPKPVATGMVGSGGGGVYAPVYVTVTGNSVRNDDDLDRLAALVGRKVEEQMGRRAKMLGFGPGR